MKSNGQQDYRIMLFAHHQYVLSYGRRVNFLQDNLWSENSMHNAIFDDLLNILEYIDINL